ncbi:MAG: malate/L-lactate dehydrogenase family protein [Rhodobacteraceae bacterium HLUCCA12]|nr:MAG: malate/L-lactate dehydrogenase family protein [Rhodobacteraceae bacterium HLUCCA12]
MMIAFPEAVERLAVALGGGPSARLAASALIEADALGMPRFGVDILDEWSADAAPLPADAAPQAVSWRDCSACFAPLAVAAATLELCDAARRMGVAVVFLRGVRGFGRLAPFVRHLADAGLIGVAGAEGPPFVAAHGGTRPVIGTNPLALAMGQGAERVVIDLASSSGTMADVRSARAEGRPLQEGLALDGMGQPTRTAAEVAALLPRGGQVGSLLGLMVELIAGVAGGGRGDPEGRGVFLLAIDPGAAAEAADIQNRLAGLQRDWVDGGGHWPRGGGQSAEAALDAAFVQRLDAHLARMSAQKGR